MPGRSYPTARQRRLGAELRKMRERAGMSGAEAAAFLGGQRAQISHIESGRFGVSADRVRRLASHYSATDRHLIDALAAMADERGKGWWEEYRGILAPEFLDLSELEHHASYLRSIQLMVIPGIFQTESYARSLISSGIDDLPGSEIDARVQHRMQRRRIFDRPKPAPFEAFIHEAALRLRYTDADVMREQLAFLNEVSLWPTVTIRVIPFSARITGSAESALYAGADLPALDSVQRDHAFGSGILDAEAHLVRYRALFDSIASISLDAEESSKLIQRTEQEM
ncbi:helix-turn-helix transcriptional regulator [Streptomyces sp. NPDC003077]|uniref:helix-turn-helix domain-containing protein n=1 Tax=Streptomyces sp. NPDC003077 TaxID=3154443 RepID=UPI0033BFAFD8